MRKKPDTFESNIADTRQEVKTLLKWIVALVVIIGLPWSGWALLEHRIRLSYIPSALAVSDILYVTERTLGFGPGADSAVLVVYEMPEGVADRLRTNGVPYLHQLKSGPPSNGWGAFEGKNPTYSDWRPTPIELTDQWSTPPFEGQKYWVSPGIGDLLMHGPMVPLDAEYEKLINDAIFAPGSYYGYGKSKQLIILIPHDRRIIYAQAG